MMVFMRGRQEEEGTTDNIFMRWLAKNISLTVFDTYSNRIREQVRCSKQTVFMAWRASVRLAPDVSLTSLPHVMLVM